MTGRQETHHIHRLGEGAVSKRARGGLAMAEASLLGIVPASGQGRRGRWFLPERDGGRPGSPPTLAVIPPSAIWRARGVLGGLPQAQ